MSEPCQIYVRYPYKGTKKLIARDFGWCYGARLVSRARWIVEWINGTTDGDFRGYLSVRECLEKFLRVIDTNFDMKDVAISGDIVQEWRDELDNDDFADYVFRSQNSSNGQLFIDLLDDGSIRYAFWNSEEEKLMDASAYMTWNNAAWENGDESEYDDFNVCRENITALESYATLMTADELRAFIEYPYVLPDDGDVKQYGLALTYNNAPYSVRWYDTDAERAKVMVILDDLCIPYEKWLSVLPYKLSKVTYGRDEIPNRRFRE